MAAPPLLIVDDDAVSRRVLSDTLSGAGFECVALNGGAAALEYLEHETPRLVLLDLVMPEPDGHDVLRHMKHRATTASIPVLVLTALDGDDDIARVFAAGADDYIHKPFRPAEVLARIRSQLRLNEAVVELRRRERGAQALLELTQALASNLDIRNILFTVVERMAEVARVDRCSIVLVPEDATIGYVVASSDDAEVQNLPIDLGRYPEIRRVLESGQALVVPDASRHPLLVDLEEATGARRFTTLGLVPIPNDRRPTGVLFFRARREITWTPEELGLFHTVASATGIALRNARLLQSLRDETAQIDHARAEAERRVRQFQRYAGFFESASVGLVVVDFQGRVLFANSRASELTGHSGPALLGATLTELLTADSPLSAAALLRACRAGAFPRDVDATLRRADGRLAVVNLSVSPVEHEGDALLVSLRDVTLERTTAIELRQTKEFLERVIDSSVDGIVSADLSGRITLFNRSASRLFGHAPEDVIGKLPVERLYPPGVAREVMRRIREQGTDGPGRLANCRVNILSASGQALPVTISAALILDGERVVGSVGVFTDMRDRLSMEARLTETQAALHQRERQAIVAELAGATAHELNQPLTSIIGYAALLCRQLPAGSPLYRAAEVVAGEAERMADIVRKIGKITHYETKSYVGAARILDLERSTDTPED